MVCQQLRQHQQPHASDHAQQHLSTLKSSRRPFKDHMCSCSSCLLSLQLPKHIDEQLVLSAISVEKDVDGFHPLNMGRLCMKVRATSLSTTHACHLPARKSGVCGGDVSMPPLPAPVGTCPCLQG
jgi:hypothetical protein